MREVLDVVWHEASKLNPALVLLVISLLLSWFIGLRLTANWNVRQKKKELDLSTAHEFHSIYGQFFAIWKLWQNLFHALSPADSHGLDPERFRLLERACDVEGALESTLVRIACERTLSPRDIEDLARFRQLFQQLRESINAGKQIPWTSSEHPDYRSFKTFATRVAVLIVSDSPPPAAEAATAALLEITSNKWEQRRVGDIRRE